MGISWTGKQNCIEKEKVMAVGMIQIPTYLLSDADLQKMAAKLEEIDDELGNERAPCPRAAKCISQINKELHKRGETITKTKTGYSYG